MSSGRGEECGEVRMVGTRVPAAVSCPVQSCSPGTAVCRRPCARRSPSMPPVRPVTTGGRWGWRQVRATQAPGIVGGMEGRAASV